MNQRDSQDRIEDMVRSAMELAGQNREAFLDLQCHGDHELRRRVQSLLDVDRANGDEMGAGTDISVGNAQENSTAPGNALELHRTFVGRESELKQLFDRFETLRHRRGSALLLIGNSGIGKTELLSEFLRGLGAHSDALVLSADCHRQESGPYHVVEQWIDTLCQYLSTLSNEHLDALMPSSAITLASLFPAVQRFVSSRPTRPPEPDGYKKELRWDAFHALRDLLTRLADQVRLVLVIDDLQWADADSLDLLRSILRFANQPAALFVGCCRSEDLENVDSLGLLVESIGNVEPVPLGPLDEHESKQLALKLIENQSVTSDPQELAQVIADESMGNPIFLYELVRQLQGRDTSPVGESRLSVERMIWNRIQQLPEPARFLLYTCCVAGRPLPEAFLLAVLRVQASESTSLETLRREGLIRDCGDEQESRIDIAHDRIHEIVVPRLGNEVHSNCRQRLAEVGETHLPQEVEFLATQFQWLNQPDKAGDFFVLAADRSLERFAFNQAAAYYDEAIRLSTFPASRKTGLRAAMAEALSSAGRSEEAAREYLRLADSLTGTASLDIQRQAFTQFLQTGRIHEGMSVLKDVLDELGMRIPRTTRGAIIQIQLTRLRLWLRGMKFRLRSEDQISPADLLRIDVLWSVAVCLRRIDLIRGVAFGARSCLEAIRVGEPNRIARGLALEGMHLAVPGERSSGRAEKLIETAKRLVADTDDMRVRTQVTMCEGITSALLGRWKQCFSQSEQAEEGYRSNEVGEITTSRFWQMYALVWLGQFAELQRRCTTLVESADERGDLYEIVSLGTYTLAIARLAQDRPRDAWDEVSSIMDRWTQEEFQVQHHLELVAKVSVLLYEGNHRDAGVMLSDSWSLHKQSLIWGAHLVRANMLHLRARIALKALGEGVDRANSVRDAREALDALLKEKLPWTTALATVGEASLEHLTGSASIAMKKFEQAAKSFELLDMELYSAVSHRRVGQIMGGERGRELVDGADASMRQQQIVAPEKLADFLVPGSIGASA